MKKYTKLLLTAIGICIFIFTIIEEIDGIGRFACILSGILFSLVGSFMKIDDKK